MSAVRSHAPVDAELRPRSMAVEVRPLSAAADQRLSPPEHFGFAADLAWVGVNDTEYHLTAHHLPLAVRFVDGAAHLGALAAPGFLARPVVDPQGRWRAGYMMLALRTHPFVLLTEKGARPIDEIGVFSAGGRIGARGVAICADPAAGALGPELTAIHNTLLMMRDGAARLSRALDLLTIANILVPLRSPDGAPCRDFTVDASRLSALDAGSVAALAAKSFLALDLATAILFSRRHLNAACQPAAEGVRATSPDAAAAAADPTDFMFANLGTMNFALDGSDLFDSVDFASICRDFAPPAQGPEELRP